MRIRSTKPEFWRSRTVATVDWDARFVLKGLESYVDDNGVGKDDIALIVGDLFSRDLVREPSRTLARVSEALTALRDAGLIHRYDDGERDLLYISNWDSIQRVDKPQAGRFRRPDGTMNYKDSVIREAVATPREPSRTLAPVTGEQGNRGTGDSASRVAHATAPHARANGDTAGALLAEWIDHCDNPPPSRVKGQLAKEIKTLLTDGIPYDDVRRGLAAWHTKSLHPSTLASVVHELRNPATAGRARPPTDRQAEILRAEMERARIADAQNGRQEIGA